MDGRLVIFKLTPKKRAYCLKSFVRERLRCALPNEWIRNVSQIGLAFLMI
jgi:hypothetical protein